MGFSYHASSCTLLLCAVAYAENPAFNYAKDTLGCEYGEIIFSAVVFRHGDRYAFGDFPTNEQSEFLKANDGLLTEAGKIRAHTLGRWTRMRYQQLLDGSRCDDLYSLGMISSSFPRVVLSAELFLRGFHDPKIEDVEGYYPWEVTAMPTDDRMMSMREHCARYNVEVDAVKKISTFTAFFEGRRELCDSVEKFTGLKLSLQDPIRTVAEIFVLYDTLTVMKQLNLKLPEWMPEIYARLHEFAVMLFKLHTLTQKMKRLKAGPLLGHIVSELEGARDNRTPRKKLQFYAGHDSNIVALLDALGLGNCDETNCELAPYSSALLFELRRDREELFVTLMYRKNENDPPTLMDIPQCPTPCKLEYFSQFAKAWFIPTDWATECEIEAGDRSSNETDYNTLIF